MSAKVSPARRAFWKRYQPTSCRDALHKCKEHAREVLNLSVERVADLMGLPDHWNLYKWIESGRMPFVLVPLYESVCGINLASRWMAATQGRLLVEMPTGRAADSADLVQLGSGFQSAVQLLSDFYKANGSTDGAELLQALRNHLESVAYHHANVAGFAEPELDFA